MNVDKLTRAVLRKYGNYLPAIATRLRLVSPNISYWFNKKRHKYLKRIISQDVEMKFDKPDFSYSIDRQSQIFIMWWDEKFTPPIVKICINTIRKCAGAHPVTLITKENFHELISQDVALKWDNAIMDYLASGQLTLTTLSDIIRGWCLYNFGGIWVDATIFFNLPQIDMMIQNRYFSTRKIQNDQNKNQYVAEGKWSGFFMMTGKYNPLMKFIYEGIVAILKKRGSIYEYFTIEYLIAIFYDNNLWFKELIDGLEGFALSRNNIDLNAEWTSDLLRRYDRPFYKLSFKTAYQELTPSGMPTLYKVLCDKYV